VKRDEVIRALEEMADLDGDQKHKLAQIVINHPDHFKSTYSWIKVVRAFASDSFDIASPPDKSEIIRILSAPIREKNRAHVLWKLLAVFMGKEGMVTDAGVFIPSRFVELVLRRSRSEDNWGRKQLLVEILLHCSPSPPGGCTPEDYLPGFHCRDELSRCKTLHFLYKHYHEAALLLVIHEIPGMKPAPSPLFYGTLTYYLRLHPEINWVEKIEAVIHSNSNPLATCNEKGGLMLLFQEMKMSAARHQILSLDTEINRTSQGHANEQKDAIHESDPTRESTGIRLARFKKIGSRLIWR
jgi:hypothetical protein